MVKLSRFSIEFENTSGVFFTGQVVNGQVFLTLNEPMKMRGVRLKLLGKAYCHWTETRTRTRTDAQGRTSTHTETVSYSDWEYYINTEVTLWGKQKGASGDNPEMPPGNYQLPFSFVLPPNCPSSYEGTWGHIRYTCKAVIDKPWKFDHTTKRPMTVIALVDLNQTGNAAMGLTDERMKTLGCLCCETGTISCQIKVPRSGFVSGERIPLELQVVNPSTTKIDEVAVSIEEEVDFFAQGCSRHSSRTIAKLKKGAIEPGQTQLWTNNEGPLIPPVAPTLLNCRIIKINYMLHINVDPSGMHTDLSIRLPIIIGNVPLRFLMQELHQMYERSNSFQPDSRQLGTTYVLPSAPPMPLPQGIYPDLPPPSYQQAVFGQTSIKEEDDNDYTTGEMSYAPRYPYYNWSENVIPSAPPST